MLRLGSAAAHRGKMLLKLWLLSPLLRLQLMVLCWKFLAWSQNYSAFLL